MKYQTVLLSGAGNTFHFIDMKDYLNLNFLNKKDFVKNTCQQHPADGFVFITMIDDTKYEWEFYNKDGSDAAMCGNAARCVGYFVTEIQKNKNLYIQLQTTAGLLNIAKIAQSEFRVQTTAVFQLNNENYFFCDTGVPHVVIPVLNGADFSTKKTDCELIRNSKEFLTQGTNVTLFKQIGQRIQGVTFERGVEDFTAACGTGALAIGFYLKCTQNINQAKIEMPGGIISIDMSETQTPLMTGSAVLVNYCESEALL